MKGWINDILEMSENYEPRLTRCAAKLAFKQKLAVSWRFRCSSILSLRSWERTLLACKILTQRISKGTSEKRTSFSAFSGS